MDRREFAKQLFDYIIAREAVLDGLPPMPPVSREWVLNLLTDLVAPNVPLPGGKWYAFGADGYGDISKCLLL
jgi:hypothetical protein